MNKLYICGLTGSGKGLLRPLLDGHPQIVDCAFQGLGYHFLEAAFLEQLKMPKDHSIRLMRSTPTMRKLRIDVSPQNHVDFTVGDILDTLFRTPAIRALADASMAHVLYAKSATESISFAQFDFQFFNFIQMFSERVAEKGHFSLVEDIQDCLYDCFVQNWKNMSPINSSDFYFVQTAKTGISTIDTILAKNQNRKIIVVLRDPVAASYTNAKHQLLNFQPGLSSPGIHNYFRTQGRSLLYSLKFIKKVKEFEHQVREYVKANPEIYIVSFDDLVFRTREAMEGVARFLNITPHEILYRTTLNGKAIDDADSFLGRINDDPYKELSVSQVNLLKRLYGYPVETNSFFEYGRLRFWETALRLKQTILQ